MKQLVIIFSICFFIFNVYGQPNDNQKYHGVISVEVRKLAPSIYKVFNDYELDIAPRKRGDISVMKVTLSPELNDIFSKSTEIFLSFREIPGKFSWKKSMNSLDIFIDNSNFKLLAGMKAQFQVLAKSYPNSIVLFEEEILEDENGKYVYVVKGRYAQKTYISSSDSRNGRLLIYSGLQFGDKIVTSEIISKQDKVIKARFMFKREKVNIVIMEKDKITGRYHSRNIEKLAKSDKFPDQQKKPADQKLLNSDIIQDPKIKLKKSKLEFEISSGGSLVNIKEIYNRNTGIESMIDQYAQIQQTAFTSSGDSKEIKVIFPFNFCVNYNISNNLFLKIGAEYGLGGVSFQNNYQLIIGELTEDHRYEFEYRISYIMPYGGLEIRFDSLGLYGNIGYNFTRFTHLYGFHFSENGYEHTIDEKFTTTGKSLGFALGGKYLIKLGKKIKAVIRLEYVLFNISSFKGNKITTGSDSLGGSHNQLLEGIIYSYELDPFEEGQVIFWDMFTSPPQNSSLSNIEKIALNLSGIRFMVGISF